MLHLEYVRYTLLIKVCYAALHGRYVVCPSVSLDVRRRHTDALNAASHSHTSSSPSLSQYMFLFLLLSYSLTQSVIVTNIINNYMIRPPDSVHSNQAQIQTTSPAITAGSLQSVLAH
jgi:hypothetical protein